MTLSCKIAPTPHLIKCPQSNCVGINGVAMLIFPYNSDLQTDLLLATNCFWYGFYSAGDETLRQGKVVLEDVAMAQVYER